MIDFTLCFARILLKEVYLSLLSNLLEKFYGFYEMYELCTTCKATLHLSHIMLPVLSCVHCKYIIGKVDYYVSGTLAFHLLENSLYRRLY